MTQDRSAAIDPVCGMEVEIEKAISVGLTAEHGGTTCYFCGRGCKLEFGDDANHYLTPSPWPRRGHPRPPPAPPWWL
jgi:YHS domain-containing protein